MCCNFLHRCLGSPANPDIALKNSPISNNYSLSHIWCYFIKSKYAFHIVNLDTFILFTCLESAYAYMWLLTDTDLVCFASVFKAKGKEQKKRDKSWGYILSVCQRCVYWYVLLVWLQRAWKWQRPSLVSCRDLLLTVSVPTCGLLFIDLSYPDRADSLPKTVDFDWCLGCVCENGHLVRW